MMSGWYVYHSALEGNELFLFKFMEKMRDVEASREEIGGQFVHTDNEALVTAHLIGAFLEEGCEALAEVLGLRHPEALKKQLLTGADVVEIVEVEGRVVEKDIADVGLGNDKELHIIALCV